MFIQAELPPEGSPPKRGEVAGPGAPLAARETERPNASSMDMAGEADFARLVNQVIPFGFDPTLLVLSYLISLVGAASTLELIHRRTSRRGYYNNLLLIGASITMGGVAIWSMHYIGNRATTLLDGERELQIAYNVGVTVASFFLPVFVLLVAFFVVTTPAASDNRVSWWRIGVSGFLSGCAISGMHYLGNAAISNYRCDYVAANVVGSVIVATAASTLALSLFSVWRSSWTNTWWKRVVCAIVLSGAASGMHWCAVMGTRYTLKRVNSIKDADSRNTTAIVTACLSFAACLVIAGTATWSAHIRKGYANRAQRVAVAATVFDHRGRILVTPDGLLPSEIVTSTFLQKTPNETLSTAHPLFHWIFQASRNWVGISSLLHKMNHHLANLPHHGRNVRTELELVDKEGNIIENYDTIFCELFCVAAAALASQMNESIVNAGILWDEILETGGHGTAESTDSFVHSSAATSSRFVPNYKQDVHDMAEQGTATRNRHNGQGHLMFLVRKVEADDAERLAASGYRFAEPRQVERIIGCEMKIRTARLQQKLQAMERYAQGNMLQPGVHLGLFAVRTHVHQMGFDVLVRREARNLLPSLQLPLDRLEPAHIDFLRAFEGMSLGTIVQRLERAAGMPPQDADFAALLRGAIQDLRVSVKDPVFDNAKLVSKIAQVPCASSTNDVRLATCSMIAFSMMIPIHVGVNSPAFEFAPLQLFKTEQIVHRNSPHNSAFMRSVHREISRVLDTVTSAPDTWNAVPRSRLRELFPLRRVLPSGRQFFRDAHSHGRSGRRRADKDKMVSTSREHLGLTPVNTSAASLPQTVEGGPELYHISNGPGGTPGPDVTKWTSRKRHQQLNLPFGSIMISQEVTVDVEDAADCAPMVPGIPPPAHWRDPSSGSQRSQRPLQVPDFGGSRQEPVSFDRAIELQEVSTVLGLGGVKVEVKGDMERDVAPTTFVDDLFSSCIDTPKRM
ncbi:hypothetical protein VTK26DRAFT_736 [Humicola hyalothermophila]